jgi:murein DD-endopeptidase MepM/ murein hydrolase activator NlpD
MQTYTVQSGDTLYGISKQFGVSVDELQRINNLTSNTITKGQTLKIPSTVTTIDYVVKKGDSLYSIAKKYNLKFISFDKSKSSSDYKDLQKKLKITDKEIKEPAVIIIKDGKLKSIANEIYNSGILRSMLIEQGIITDETKDDKEVTMVETMEKFQGEENSLLVLLDSSTNSVEAREVLNNLASKYNFTFSLAYFDRSDEGMSIATFLNQMNGDDLLVVPYFAVVSNNKIQEAISTTSSTELEAFLKKNKIIK